jgi:hydroxypyruvate isomerase
MKFVANLSMLFTEVSLIERFQLAQLNGFEKVEVQFPYSLSIEEIQIELQKNQLQMVLHNLPAGNWQIGDRGIACQKERQQEFLEGLERAVEYATALGVQKLNCLSGIKSNNTPHQEAKAIFLDNLKVAAKFLATSKIELLIEPINTIDIPGFFLSKPEQAFDYLDELKIDNLKVQYDIYHAQKSQGNVIETIQKNMNKIGHIQFADNPGRHEPGTGELNWPFIFKSIEQFGYDQYIAAEYIPSQTTEKTLEWLKDY